MKEFKRIGLYGVSGAGKTTILTKVNELMPNVIWLEGSKLITNTEKITLDIFRKKTEKQKYILREKAISQAFEIQSKEKKHIVIDAHVAFVNQGKFQNIITKKDMDFYTDYIYLDLPVKTILNQQKNDTNRKRNFSLDMILNWKKFELYELKLLCDNKNKNLHILSSTNNQECVDFICNYIKG